MNEIHGFPTDQTSQLWEKINFLVQDPFPDGKLKKKLKTKRNLSPTGHTNSLPPKPYINEALSELLDE